MSLERVSIEVRDLFAMELFYRAGLGFALACRYRSPGASGRRSVLLRRGELALELIEHSGEKASPQQLALAVEDVDAAHRHLADLNCPGAVLHAPRDLHGGDRQAIVFDPEGHRIALSARGPERCPAVRAVVFDWDGTLIDSEPNYYLADARLLARFGVEFSEEDKRRYIGSSSFEQMNDFKRRYALKESPEELAATKNTLYLELAQSNTRVFAQMRRFLDRLRERAVPVAVASGSALPVLERLLCVSGLAGLFEVVVSADEVGKGKPSPDIFLEAARRLRVAPEECVVVEDSRYGVEAAVRAFMRCIAVPYLSDPPLDPVFDLADLLFAGGMRTFDAERAFAFIEERFALP
ncbi:MAG TPA: HAD-IA family hydrolase [Anaeromyxobacteraceae bacterium]|nr:HAD-IA family hydrolase [Anaeromyxobacteraceae bacterium]